MPRSSCAPGLISRDLAMVIKRAPRSQFWAIILATKAGAFASRRLNSLDEMGSGTIVVDKSCAYFEAPWWSMCIVYWWEAISKRIICERKACSFVPNGSVDQCIRGGRCSHGGALSSSPRELSCGAFHFFLMALIFLNRTSAETCPCAVSGSQRN